MFIFITRLDSERSRRAYVYLVTPFGMNQEEEQLGRWRADRSICVVLPRRNGARKSALERGMSSRSSVDERRLRDGVYCCSSDDRYVGEPSL